MENLCDVALSKVQQNRPFERSLLTLRDPAPLRDQMLQTKYIGNNDNDFVISGLIRASEIFARRWGKQIVAQGISQFASC